MERPVQLKSNDAIELYLDLMKRVLTRSGFPEMGDVRVGNWKRHFVQPLQRRLAARGYRLVFSRSTPSGQSLWPPSPSAETMISLERLDNVRECIEKVLSDGVLGDIIETGVWRGGTTIFMRAVLAAHSVRDRTVWVADSFRGFPMTRHHEIDDEVDFTAGLGDDALSVDLDTVRQNFERYGLLDDQVRFLVGWFSETLATAPIERLAVLRLDCDMYESTWNALVGLYPRLSRGGYAIVDDYGAYEACRKAVDNYRAQHAITEPLERIDTEAVYWRKGWEAH
jgi:hypothetical protein